MAEQTEGARIRRLPDGNPHLVLIESLGGLELRITGFSEENGADFGAGALVEVQCERVLYFGEVLGRKDSTLIVAIEHALDRAALAAIQDVWQGAPAD